MKPILERLDVLHEFARSDVLLDLDFDGTLAPVTAHPDRAQMRASTYALLAEVARRYPCALVSGRSQDDVAARVEGITFVAIVGNHGIEPSGRAAAFTKTCSRWADALERALASTPAVAIENKGPSLSIHYRAARDQGDRAARPPGIGRRRARDLRG